MSSNEILATAHNLGIVGDAHGVALLCSTHGFVVQNSKAKRNIGRVPVMDIMAAYARGIRARFAA
jgi:hypothetical protein